MSEDAKDADVDRLRVLQIRGYWDDLGIVSPEDAVWRAEQLAICDLALQSLSQEAVRDEALEEVARRGIKLPVREEWDGQNYLVDANGKVVSKETLANILLHALKREPNAAAPGASDD